MKTILLISPYWKEPHRWMVSSVKMAELWQRLGYRVVVACMGDGIANGEVRSAKEIRNSQLATQAEDVSPTLRIYRKKDLFLPDPWNYGIALGFSGFVRSIIRTEKPDEIVVNKVLFWTSLSLLSLRLRDFKVTLLTDALVGMTWWPRGKIPQVAAAIYAWTLGWLILGSASRIVFFHPQPARLLKRLGIAGKSQVIPTGIDPTRYTHTRPASAVGDPVTITYVGRLESVKGVDDFLAATVALLESHPELHIQVAGFYEEGNGIVAHYKDRVEFMGLRDDVPAVLAKSDIFVMPSYSEGLSNALMEAMASGCACIATEVGGNAFLIQNGVSGFLFQPGDRDALTSRVRGLLEDASKRKNMGAAARERIEASFSWNIIGERYKNLFGN